MANKVRDLRGFPLTKGLDDFQRKVDALEERKKKGKAEEPVVQAVLKSYLSRSVGPQQVERWLRGGALRTTIRPEDIGD